MAYRRKNRRRKARRVRRPRKMAMVKRVGNTGFFHTKEQVLTNYQLENNSRGFSVVNGFNSALTPTFADTVKWEDVAQSGVYASLWKLYKITGVSYTFMPPHNFSPTDQTASVGTTYQNNRLPMFWYKFARNNVNNPNDEDDIINMCPKMIQFGRPIRIYVRNPKCLNSVWKGPEALAGSVDVVATTQQWVDTETDDIQHMTLQWGIAFGTPNYVTPLQVIKKLYFSLKAPK